MHKTEEDSAAISVNVYLKNQFKRLRRPIPYEFGHLRVKGRQVLGNIVTKNPVERVARIMPVAPDPDAPAEQDAAIMPPTPAVADTPAMGGDEAPAISPVPTEDPNVQQMDLGFDV